MRVSFSILDSWARGDYDRAVGPFLGVEIPPTEAMLRGNRLHKEWEVETLGSGCLPKVFGGAKLVRPSVEGRTKKVIAINEWLTLSGILDLKHGEEGEIVEDYKTSVSKEASDFTNSFQHKVYHVLYPEAKVFVYRVYNPITKEVSVSKVHLTRQTLLDGLEWILTHGADLKDYLEKNDISTERKVTEVIN